MAIVMAVATGFAGNCHANDATQVTSALGRRPYPARAFFSKRFDFALIDMRCKQEHLTERHATF